MPAHTKLTHDALQKIIEGARILEQDSFGPKVYQLQSGEILKLFRRKRLFSSALLRPHSQRFCANAVALHKLGIPTIQPLQIYQLEDPIWTAVRYRPLPGKTLSQLLLDAHVPWSNLLPDLARFINRLHESGVYFRSLHLGNIVCTPEDELGLIDIADLQIRRHPLGPHLIRRNREHFEKYLRKEGLSIDAKELWTNCESLRQQAGVRSG